MMIFTQHFRGAARRFIARTGRARTVPTIGAAALLTFGPLLGLANLAIQNGTQAVREEVDGRLWSTASLSARYVGSQMQEVAHVAAVFAGGPAFSKAVADGGNSPESSAVLRSRLAQLQEAVAGSKDASVLDPSGTVIAMYPADPTLLGKNLSNRDYFRQVMARRVPFVSGAFISVRQTHDLLVGVAAPVFTDDSRSEISGVLRVAYPLSTVQAFTDQFGAAGKISLTVVDQSGNVVAGAGVPGNSLRRAVDRQVLRSALSPATGTRSIDVGGTRTLTASANIPGLGWTVISQLDEGQAMVSATELRKDVVFLTGILSLVILGGLALLGMSLVQRRRAEREVRDLGEQRSQLLDELPVGVFLLGMDGQCQYANTTSKQLLGPGLEPGPDRLVYPLHTPGTEELIPPEKLARARALGGEHVRGLVMDVVHPGQRVVVEAWSSPIFSREGKQTAAVTALLDITERRRSETALAHAHETLRLALVSLRDSDRVRKRLLERLITAQEEERHRVALDIHDDAVQVMTAASIRLVMLGNRLEDKQYSAEVDQLVDAVTAAIVRLRTLMFELEPPALERFGLVASIRTSLEMLSADTGIKYSLTGSLTEEPPLSRGVLIYRIVQETLSNIRKHSCASMVTVRISSAARAVVVSVSDDGIGFDGRPGVEPAGVFHLGIASMRERAHLAGGRLVITGGPGVGTQVEVRVPYDSIEPINPAPLVTFGLAGGEAA